LVKRYVAEPHSRLVREAMDEATDWCICRIGFVETMRAVGLAAGMRATRAVKGEWPAFAIVEVDQALVERAAALTSRRDLRSLDSLHLAAGLLVADDDLLFATWDRRLHAAAAAEGLKLLPGTVG
jgi:predicted nucleic acid-binding protein